MQTGADLWRQGAPPSNRAQQQSYLEDLDRQMKEKKERLAREKAELEAFELKQDLQAKRMEEEEAARRQEEAKRRQEGSKTVAEAVKRGGSSNEGADKENSVAQQQSEDAHARRAAKPQAASVAQGGADEVAQLQRLLEVERQRVRQLTEEAASVRQALREEVKEEVRQELREELIHEQMEQRQSEWERRCRQDEAEWRRQAERRMREAVEEMRREAEVQQQRMLGLLQQVCALPELPPTALPPAPLPATPSPSALPPWPQGTIARRPSSGHAAALSRPPSRPWSAEPSAAMGQGTMPPEELQKLLDDFLKHGISPRVGPPPISS